MDIDQLGQGTSGAQQGAGDGVNNVTPTVAGPGEKSQMELSMDENLDMQELANKFSLNIKAPVHVVASNLDGRPFLVVIERSEEEFKYEKVSSKCDSHGLIYIDLQNQVIKEFASTPTNFMVDDDKAFQLCLEKFLNNKTSRRTLFTPQEDDDVGVENRFEKKESGKLSSATVSAFVSEEKELADDTSNHVMPGTEGDAFILLQNNLSAINAQSIAKDKPVKIKPILLLLEPRNKALHMKHKYVTKFFIKYAHKYSFLKSLDPKTPDFMCHPNAIGFRSNFKEQKGQLAAIIYDVLNHEIFNCALKVQVKWNKKTTQTSNCLNTIKGASRHSVIELSNVLVATVNSLIISLAHEMCHAAAWVYSGEMGHGDICAAWVMQVRHSFPEIPHIGNCGRLVHLYTYTCALCKLESHGSLKAIPKNDNIRCVNCLGPIRIKGYVAEADTHVLSNNKERTGFEVFLKENYKKVAGRDSKHSKIMMALNEQYKRSLQS